MQLPALLGNYECSTNRPTDEPTDRRKIVPSPFFEEICEKKLARQLEQRSSIIFTSDLYLHFTLRGTELMESAANSNILH